MAVNVFAARVGAELRAGDAVLLEGELGAGKTAFARALLRAVTGDEALEVPSPSFTLVQSYEARGLTLHHFDLWRLSGADGVGELGWDDARRDVVVVEWPDRLGKLRPAGALVVSLQVVGQSAREAVVEGWAAERLTVLSAAAGP
jgi:tRNA threonylcarbamoyladenosine biosynthesis protein TsaE